jgi:glycosyltransferase involved in cell wall biosynthesis
MRASCVGLVPHRSNEHTENTVPHKLFQYMMVGLPVLVSSCRPLARYVDLAGGGLVFKADDPQDFARQALALAADPALREKLGTQGRKATLEGVLNWSETGRHLAEGYRRFEVRA